MGANNGPGYKQHPEHEVRVEHQGRRVRVVFAGEVIADSADPITLHESRHGPVFYLPRRDVRMDRLARTAHHSYCPFKGEASYYTIKGERPAENAVWSYEQPYDEVSEIREHLAFYPDRVDSISQA